MQIKLSYIGASLDNTQAQTWVPNSLALMQAVISPMFSSASDVFQARKWLLVGSSTISFIGAAIAPGSPDIYRLIGATILIGVGFSSVGLAFAVPSEILPRKWRPSECHNVLSCAVLIIRSVSGFNESGGMSRRNDEPSGHRWIHQCR